MVCMIFNNSRDWHITSPSKMAHSVHKLPGLASQHCKISKVILKSKPFWINNVSTLHVLFPLGLYLIVPNNKRRKQQQTCCMVFIRLKEATYARYLLGGAWGVVSELVPNPKVLSPNPTPVQVVMPPRVGGGECRNRRRLIGYNSSSGVGSPFVGVITCKNNDI